MKGTGKRSSCQFMKARIRPKKKFREPSMKRKMSSRNSGNRKSSFWKA
jgi:hypothetical protein